MGRDLEGTKRKYYLEHQEEIKAKRRLHYQNNKEASKEYTKAWRKKQKAERPEEYKAWRKTERKKARMRNKAKVEEYKSLHSCCLCGENNPVVLVFHHKDGNEKNGNISTMAQAYSCWKQIGMEIEKCVILCSNCHLIIHDKMKQLGTLFSLDETIKAKKERGEVPTLTLPLSVDSAVTVPSLQEPLQG